MRFSDVNDGGASGGGAGDASGGAGGGQGGAGGDGNGDVIVTPFDKLDLSEFDDDVRKQIEAGKAEFIKVATLQRKTAADLTHTQGLARRFQSDADRLTAEAKKGQHREPEKDPYLEIAQNELKAANYKPEDIEKLAPVFAGIQRKAAEVTRKQMGSDLGPLANTVIANEASNAFIAAQQEDRIGYFQIPQVAQKVWEMVSQRVSEGQPTNSNIVSNLGKMVYVDHIQSEAAAGRTVTLPTLVVNTPGMTTRPPGFTYPGANFPSHLTPAIPVVPDPKAARTTLNEDTQNALQATFKHLQRDTGVAPKSFGGVAKKVA